VFGTQGTNLLLLYSVVTFYFPHRFEHQYSEWTKSHKNCDWWSNQDLKSSPVETYYLGKNKIL